MRLLRTIFAGLGALFAVVFVFGTVCPMITTKIFWIRLFDFPRLQLMAIGVLAVVLLLVGLKQKSRWVYGAVALIVAGLVWQGVRVFPYTPLASKQVEDASASAEGDRVRLLTCNVYQHNKDRSRLLDQIRPEKPDIILLLEVNAAWAKAVEVLHGEYTHRILHPLENTWGIALYSKFALDVEDVHYYASEDRPAVRAIVSLPSGRKALFLGLHPAPPGYKEPDGERISSAPRDHTLMMAAKEAKSHEGPVIAAGDFNDAAWSRMTRRFQEISGLKDPRVGRGLFNTYDANNFFLRYPIDHVFVSSGIDLLDLRRLPHVGSDHFPMYVELLLPKGRAE